MGDEVKGWTIEERPHGAFLLKSDGYPVVMMSPAAPGHIIDTSARIADALNLASRPSPEGKMREALADLIEGVREVRVEGATIVLICESRPDAQGRVLNARAALATERKE